MFGLLSEYEELIDNVIIYLEPHVILKLRRLSKSTRDYRIVRELNEISYGCGSPVSFPPILLEYMLEYIHNEEKSWIVGFIIRILTDTDIEFTTDNNKRCLTIDYEEALAVLNLGTTVPNRCRLLGQLFHGFLPYEKVVDIEKYGVLALFQLPLFNVGDDREELASLLLDHEAQKMSDDQHYARYMAEIGSSLFIRRNALHTMVYSICHERCGPVAGWEFLFSFHILFQSLIKNESCIAPLINIDIIKDDSQYKWEDGEISYFKFIFAVIIRESVKLDMFFVMYEMVKGNMPPVELMDWIETVIIRDENTAKHLFAIQTVNRFLRIEHNIPSSRMVIEQ